MTKLSNLGTISVLFACLLVAACGQKGPLYLTGEDDAAIDGDSVYAPDSSASDSDADDGDEENAENKE